MDVNITVTRILRKDEKGGGEKKNDSQQNISSAMLEFNTHTVSSE
jgi:hypothetical protein